MDMVGSSFPPPDVSTSQQRSIRSRKGRVTIADIDYKHLDALRQEFLNRWDGEDLGLTREEFMAAVRKTVGFGLDREEVERIYSKVDSKETGLMQWSQYIACLSQTTRLEAYMERDAIKPLFSEKLNFRRYKQRDEIVAIRFLPRVAFQDTELNYSCGRYVMLGRAGTLTVWSLNMCCLGSHFIGTAETNKSMHFVDMIVLYPTAMIAVTATDRKIIVYEIGSRGIKERYSIVTLSNCLTCLDYWADLRSRTFSLLLWGDTGGDIHALELNVNRLGGMFGKDNEKETIRRVVYSDLLKNKIPTAHLHRVAAVHNDWVTSVMYLPDTQSFLSSSRSATKQSMCYSDWFGRVDTRYYLSSKAVMCFDYRKETNFLVTGCLDCKVRVWNFFLPQRAVFVFRFVVQNGRDWAGFVNRAHSAPITHVALNPATKSVISVDRGRGIYVFDYMDGTIIQYFCGPSLQCMGQCPITGFFFNVVKCELIVATTIVCHATKKVNPADVAEIAAHDYPISALCYSHTFEELITSSYDKAIAVWDLHTGKRLLEFKHHSSRNSSSELPWSKENTRVEVTAMTLDSNERCLVTGANDGTVNLWNFSAGLLLSHYALPDVALVTGLAVNRNTIYATGWCKQIYLLDLNQKAAKETLKYFQRYHKEEVNCLTLVRGGLIASGSYDGDIVFLGRETGHYICRLNAGASRLPITSGGKTAADSSTEEILSMGEMPVSRSASTELLDHEWSEEELLPTEDMSILRAIRIAPDKVMVASPVSWQPLRIIHVKESTPKPEKITSKDLVYDVFTGTKVSEDKSADCFRAYESSVEVVLCLRNRAHLDMQTATIVTAGEEGWIRAWSLHPKGGLRGQFVANVHVGESVKAMTTDKNNEFLITGDTEGYLKIWDLFPYCNAAARLLTDTERQKRRDAFTETFIYLRSAFLRDEAAEGFRRTAKYRKRPPPPESDPDKTLKTPRLLNVFHAHMQAITAMQYINDRQLIITGSRDCSVRIWTITGSFVGHCGVPWFKLPRCGSAKTPLRTLPADVRRNASARSFRVMKCGQSPLWNNAMKIIQHSLREKKKEEEKKAALAALQTKTSAEKRIQEESSCLTHPVLLDREAEISELPEHMRMGNIVAFDWQDPKKSSILGKQYKPYLHHRPDPVPVSIDMDNDFGQYAAYRQIPISDISQMTRIPTPQMIKDMEIRKKEEEEEAERYRKGSRILKRMPRKTLCGSKQKRSVAKGRDKLSAPGDTSPMNSCVPSADNSCTSPAGYSELTLSAYPSPRDTSQNRNSDLFTDRPGTVTETDTACARSGERDCDIDRIQPAEETEAEQRSLVEQGKKRDCIFPPLLEKSKSSLDRSINAISSSKIDPRDDKFEALPHVDMTQGYVTDDFSDVFTKKNCGNDTRRELNKSEDRQQQLEISFRQSKEPSSCLLPPVTTCSKQLQTRRLQNSAKRNIPPSPNRSTSKMRSLSSTFKKKGLFRGTGLVLGRLTQPSLTKRQE